MWNHFQWMLRSQPYYGLQYGAWCNIYVLKVNHNNMPRDISQNIIQAYVQLYAEFIYSVANQTRGVSPTPFAHGGRFCKFGNLPVTQISCCVSSVVLSQFIHTVRYSVSTTVAHKYNIYQTILNCSNIVEISILFSPHNQKEQAINHLCF